MIIDVIMAKGADCVSAQTLQFALAYLRNRICDRVTALYADGKALQFELSEFGYIETKLL